MKTEYVLMNQTTPMLRFSCERNAFDEPEFAEIAWLTDLRPIGYGNLNDFLARRQAPKHRRHTEKRRPEILKNMMVHSKKHKIFDIFFPLRDRHNHPIII